MAVWLVQGGLTRQHVHERVQREGHAAGRLLAGDHLCMSATNSGRTKWVGQFTNQEKPVIYNS
jgi:hypothetical protein